MNNDIRVGGILLCETCKGCNGERMIYYDKKQPNGTVCYECYDCDGQGKKLTDDGHAMLEFLSEYASKFVTVSIG